MLLVWRATGLTARRSRSSGTYTVKMVHAQNHAIGPESTDVDPTEQACIRARQLIDAGASRREILTCLASAAEDVSGPQSTVSILVIDEHGLLRDGASPSLPSDYLDAIDRLKPDPNVGTVLPRPRPARSSSPAISSPMASGPSSAICRWRSASLAPGACRSDRTGPVRCSGRSAPTTATCANRRRGNWTRWRVSPRSQPARSNGTDPDRAAALTAAAAVASYSPLWRVAAGVRPIPASSSP